MTAEPLETFRPIRPLAELGIAAGTYNEGVLSVVPEGALETVRGWGETRLEFGSLVPFAYTGFGDVFLASLQPLSIYFLETQRRRLEFVDSDLSWFLDEFLDHHEVQLSVLKTGRLRSLVAAHGALHHGQIFASEPWEMLGGEPETSTHAKVDVEVYLSLVGQAT
ncbi:MAG: T6SS immunity protein Tdi1 domain-containing protein [Acidobacteriota bacterium]